MIDINQIQIDKQYVLNIELNSLFVCTTIRWFYCVHICWDRLICTSVFVIRYGKFHWSPQVWEICFRNLNITLMMIYTGGVIYMNASANKKILLIYVHFYVIVFVILSPLDPFIRNVNSNVTKTRKNEELKNAFITTSCICFYSYFLINDERSSLILRLLQLRTIRDFESFAVISQESD